MENLELETKQQNDSGSLTVAYRGADAKGEAERLHSSLKSLGAVAEPLSEIKQDDARLGVAEIIITIVVTAAAKAVITTGLKYLEEYLSEYAEKAGTYTKFQAVVKKAGASTVKRIPFSLRGATVETVKTFSENIRQAISKL